MNAHKIKTFKDLEAWKAGHKLVLMIYRVTKAFPRVELFGLINQLRRAAVSVTSNVAEGFSRRSDKEKTQFFSMACGSITEIQNQLEVSKDVGYIERKDYTAINEQSESVHRLIRGMLRYIKAKNIVFMAVLILALILNTNYQIPNTKYQILNTTYAASSTFTESLATTGVSGNPPSVPTNLVATPVSDKEIDLSWTASQSGGLYAISGYRIFRGVDYAGTTTVATTTSTAYADTGLTASTTYTYTVEAFDANQQYSGQSVGAATTTLQVPPTPVSTATPTPVSSGGSSSIGSGAQLSISSLDIVPSQNAAEVAFDTSMPAQAKVMWGTTADYEAGSVMSIAYGTSHDLELTGLLPGTEYFVEVQAVNYLGTVASLTTSFVTAPVPPSSPEAIGPLPNPTRFAATAEQSDIALSWQNPSDPRFAKVRVVRSEAFFPKDQNDGTPVYEGSAQSFVDTGVETGKTYYYAIFAEGADGQFSSGALAQARISAAGQLSLPFDPFAALPQAQSTDPLIKALSLSDFQFIQDGKVLSTVNGHTVAVNGSENLTIRLSYDMVPEVLKTIAFTLTDPSDPSKVFPFLLRVNKDKTYYEATIAPLGRSGEYGLQIVVLDYQDQSLKRINGNIMAIAFQALPHVAKVGFDDAGVGFLFLLILAILGLIAAARSMKRRRRLAASTVIYIVSGLAFAAAALSVIGFAASAARAASYNPEINYQGKLTNASNVAVADGSYNMEFKIYNTLTGATTSALWTEDDLVSNGQGVKVTNGLFSVMLGSTTPFGNNIDWNQPLYLGVNIGGTGSSPSWDSEMSPRKIIGTVPAAFFAATSSTSTVALNAQALNSLGSSEFLRSDAQNATSTSSTFLSFLQSGAGKVAEFFGQAAESVLSLLSNGNVGIGTSTPSAKLAVSANNGETNTQLFTVASSTANSTTTLFTVLNNGNVGIGTSSPYATLSVSGPIAVSGAASANSLTINSLSGVSVRCLEVNPDGSVAANASACGSGSGSGGGTWATTTSSVANELINYSLNSTDIIAIGGTATTTAEYWFDPNAAQASFAGRLSVPYASTTAITVSGTKGLTLSNLNGPLQAVNGAVSASSTISVAYGGTGLSTSPTYGQILVGNSSGGYALTATSSLGLPQGTVTSVNASGGTTGLSFSGGPITTSGTLTLAGTLNVANGGTGWGNIQSGALLYGNGTGALSTTSAGTAGQVLALLNGVPTWAATTTFGTGLTYTNGNVTNAGVLSISQTSGTAQTGAITLGTSSQTTNGQTIGLAITNTGGAFTLTPTISGTLNNTGLTNSAVTVNAGSGLLGGGQVSLGSSVTLSAQIATSAVPTVGGLAYWTGRGTPSTLGTIATGTVTCSGGVSCGSGSYVVGSNLSLSSFSYPFALATDFGTANQATTGIVWFQNGLNASSTSVLQNASTSELTVSGQLYDKNRSAGNAGYVLMSTANGTQWVATTSIANGVT
ncbi:MAG: four helix bundle protein, partial [Patescibacteria group bacterium]|nr:four helix bundle protein [Patescibacteria group bacterium]